MDKILIIDDSQVQAEYLNSILKNDYDITMTNSATEGFQLTQEREFSLILLDVIMPDLDGFSLLHQLQESPKTKYIPVILITSLSDIQNEEKGLIMGAVDYIAKPFSPVIVRARVQTHIKLYHYQTKFRTQAMVDDLTGVANRRSYDTVSTIKWREAIRLDLPITVAMLDIDQFKEYNDHFGRLAGDEVIATVAKTVSSQLQRATDFFARYGGEEFVAILIGNKPQQAFDFLKRIRQSVEDLHIPAGTSVSPWITISVGGVTFVPKEADQYNTYIQIADTMLYDAKRFGRNRVVWSNQGKEQWREK